MNSLLRIWNWAGGELVGGALWLTLALLVWPLVLYLVIRPTGVFRGKRPTAWLWGGWLLLFGLHVLLRIRLTPPQAPPSLMLWPPERPASAEAAFGRVEQDLRSAQQAGELRWEDQVIELRITQHLLAPGRAQPDTPQAAQSLLEALQLRFLVQAERRPTGLQLTLWHLHWGVCTRDDQEAVADSSFQGISAALQRLLGRSFRGWSPSTAPWQDSWAILDQAVTDSARTQALLPTDALPPREDVRRTDLLRALGAPPAQVVDGLNRALALADSNTQAGADPWLLAGLWFAGQGKWDQVGQAMTNALALEPAHPLIYWQLAHLTPERLRSFGYESAALARARCLHLQPAFLPALMVQAPDWLAHRQGARAVAAVEAALVAYPHHPELWLLKGNLAYKLLDHATAVSAYQRCADLLPADPRPWMNLGSLYVVLKQWDKAAASLEQAVTRGAPPGFVYLLGLSHQQLGHRDLALQWYRQRLTLKGPYEDSLLTQRQIQRLDSSFQAPTK
jgi:Tfp pilus assembly protein PilF